MSPMSKIIAQRLHEVVLDGELGIDYTFAGDRAKNIACKLRLNGMPVPLLRNGYSIFNGTKYR